MFEAQPNPVTFDTFISFALLPENIERNFEFINEEMVEKKRLSIQNSDIVTNLSLETRFHCQVTELACFISTGYGPFRIGQNIIGPDFAYKRTPLTKDHPDAPLWVAEVISPTDKIVEISGKRRKYLEAGILYWELYADERLVDVYAPGKPMKTYGIHDAIMVNVILGLTIPVSKLFS